MKGGGGPSPGEHGPRKSLPIWLNEGVCNFRLCEGMLFHVEMWGGSGGSVFGYPNLLWDPAGAPLYATSDGMMVKSQDVRHCQKLLEGSNVQLFATATSE